MLKRIRSATAAVILIVLIQLTFCKLAQAQTPAKVPVTTIVSVLGAKFTEPPAITKQDIVVFSGKNRLDVTDWTLTQGQRGGLQLAIVIDNAASQFGVGSSLDDIAGFIRQQPKSTSIGLFYAVNGTVQVASPFSRDHEAVAKALRLPMGRGAGNSPSVYLSLSDLIDHRWQASGARREILLISSGVDRMNGGPQSPYVDAAVEDAQKAGIEVHAIYTAGGSFDQSMRGQFAQANLARLSEDSGGYNLFNGVSTPMSFAPYLKMLDTALRHQYRLTFTIDPSNKSNGELRDIKIRTELHGVELRYPKLIMIPGIAK